MGLKEELAGQGPNTQRVIRYFYDDKGCFRPAVKDSEYDAIVNGIMKKTDWKKKALEKLGLDEDQLREIDPIHFEGYYFTEQRGGSAPSYYKCGLDGKWRSTAYQVSWLFFSSEQVYLYQYTQHFNKYVKDEHTEEFFYKDITNFSTGSHNLEIEVPVASGCGNNVQMVKKTLPYTDFALVVPGEKLYCAMDKLEEYESSIQGMKAKFREKKNA